jgi:hypothetical protein
MVLEGERGGLYLYAVVVGSTGCIYATISFVFTYEEDYEASV